MLLRSRRMLIGSSVVIHCCLLLLWAGGADANEYLYQGKADAGFVVEHTDKFDFRTFKGPKIVEFYSPYCGGCQKFKPSYVKIAAKLKETHSQIGVFAVSCIPHKDVCTNFDIAGYPSLLAFPEGETKGTQVKHSMLSEHGFSIADLLKGAGLSNNDDNNTAESRSLQQPLNAGDLKSSGTAVKSLGEIKNTSKQPKGVPPAMGVDDDDAVLDDTQIAKGPKGFKVAQEQALKKKVGAVLSKGFVEGGNRLAGKQLEPKQSRTRNALLKEDGEEDFQSTLQQSARPGHVGGAGAVKAKTRQKDMDKWKEAVKKKKLEIMKKKKTGIFGQKLKAGAGDSIKLRDKQLAGRKKDVSEQASATTGEQGESMRGQLSKRKPNAPIIQKPSKLKKLLKKQMKLDRKAPMETPSEQGPTSAMKANLPGTKEFEEKRKDLLKKVAGKTPNSILFGQKKLPTPEQEKEMLMKKNLPKVGIKKPSLVEKIPLAKSVIKMSDEQALIVDSTLSFVKGLKYGVFMNSKPLDDGKVKALKSYLELLSISLPPEWGLHIMIDDLKHSMGFISHSRQNLDKILNKHKLGRLDWSPSCGRKTGFTCGLWKLFHIMSVGLAEHRGGLNLIEAGSVDRDTRIFSPMDAAETLRAYIENFFDCTSCKEHFLTQYDQCAFRRCDRLADSAENIDAEDWKQFSLWLWEVHNDVSIRVSEEKVQKALQKSKLGSLRNLEQDNPKDQEHVIKALFPSIGQCIACFDDDGAWDEPSVFAYLERTYWSEPDLLIDRLMVNEDQYVAEHDTASALLKFMVFFTVILLATLNKQLSSSSGIKKTLRVVEGVGNKLGDKFQGKKRKA